MNMQQRNIQKILDKLEQIKQEVAVHDYNKYVLNRPLISDSEYRAVLQEKYILELKLEALAPKQFA